MSSFDLSRGAYFYLEVSGKFNYRDGKFENEHLEIDINDGRSSGMGGIATLMILYKNTGAIGGYYNKIFLDLSNKEFLDIKESLLKMIPPEQRSLVLLQQGGVSKRKTTKKKTSKKKTSKK